MANVSTVTEADVEGRWEAVHPGEVLLEGFLQEWGVSQRSLALAIGVPPQRINDIVHGKRRVTADTALRLAEVLRNHAEVLAQRADDVRPGSRSGRCGGFAGGHHAPASCLARDGYERCRGHPL